MPKWSGVNTLDVLLYAPLYNSNKGSVSQDDGSFGPPKTLNRKP